MIKDRRSTSRIIPIEFIAKEEFQMYPQADYMTITLVTDGIWEFILNGQEERREAPFILCLNDRDVFTLLHKSRAAAKTFLFYPTFLNSSLTKQALLHDNFEKIEDMHDSNLMPIRLVTLLLDSAIEANCQKKPGELLFHSALSQELTTAPNSMDYS